METFYERMLRARADGLDTRLPFRWPREENRKNPRVRHPRRVRLTRTATLAARTKHWENGSIPSNHCPDDRGCSPFVQDRLKKGREQSVRRSYQRSTPTMDEATIVVLPVGLGTQARTPRLILACRDRAQ